MKKLDQFDYEVLNIKDKWCLSDALKVLTNIEMEMKGYFKNIKHADIYDKLYFKYFDYVTDLMLNLEMCYTTSYDEEGPFIFGPDPENYDLDRCIREFNTYFLKEDLVKCISSNNTKLKVDLDFFAKILSGDVMPEEIDLPEGPKEKFVFEKVIRVGKKEAPLVARAANVPDDKAHVQNEDKIDVANIACDGIYPDFKGLKLEKLTIDQFTELKKKYGMALVEIEKWKKCLHVATNIGLLFYENKLCKPATNAEFMKAYKREFTGIPLRLIEAVYNSLPKEYTSLAGPSGKELDTIDDDMLDTIIEASVAAGLICGVDDIKDGKDLEQKLTRLGLPTPPLQHVRTISGACKRVLKKYEAGQE